MRRILIYSDEGSILIITLMLFAIVSIMAVSLLKTGFMEYKSSQFEKNLQQAQLGADAAIEWGIESAYKELNQPENLISAQLPLQLECSGTELVIGQKGCSAVIGPVTKLVESGGEPGHCCYGFTVSAVFEGARRQVMVEAIYGFCGGYDAIDPDGHPVFLPRIFVDRGRIGTYQYHYT